MSPERNDPRLDLVIENGVVKAYTGSGGQVVLPEGITAIGDNAFKDQKQITAISIPEGVTSIGRDAFNWCKALLRVTIPSTVTSIEPNAFYGCDRLSHLIVSPDNIVYKNVDNVIYSRDGHTLVACAGGASVFSIPADVTRIENRAFCGCRSLTEIILPDGLEQIDEGAFSFCTSLRRVTIPGSVDRVGERAFFFCENLIDAVLEPGISDLGAEAFRECRRMTSISLPESLTAMGSRVFYDCDRLASISIPRMITHIAEGTFTNCRALMRVSMPKTITHIDANAFYGCYRLPHMDLPSWLTSISPRTLAYCSSLQSVSLPSGLKDIQEGAFMGCKALTDVVFPDGLVSIAKNAFHGCASLTSAMLPDSVTSIGKFAFSDCAGLAVATYSDGVESVDAFSGCTGLREYTVSRISRRYKAVDGVVFSRDGRKLICYPSGRRCERYDIPETVTEVCAGAFLAAAARIIVVHEGVDTFSPSAANGTDDGDPFVASARPSLMADLGKPIFLGPLDELPIRQRKRVIDGFLMALEMGMPEIEPWKDSYLAYVQQEYAVCERKAWKDERLLRLLMEQRLLKPETARNMMRKYSATKRPELAAELFRYLASLSVEDAAEAQRPWDAEQKPK